MKPFLRSVGSDGAGYLATVAFLGAYLLCVTDTGRPFQIGLNLIGAAVAAGYLYKKDAIPSVISNVAWIAITIGGVIAG